MGLSDSCYKSPVVDFDEQDNESPGHYLTK